MMKRREFLKLLGSLPFVGFLFKAKAKAQSDMILQNNSTLTGYGGSTKTCNGSMPVDLGTELNNLFRIASQGDCSNSIIMISKELRLAIEEKWGVSCQGLVFCNIPVMQSDLLPFYNSKGEKVHVILYKITQEDYELNDMNFVYQRMKILKVPK